MFKFSLGLIAYCWVASGFATTLYHFSIQSSNIELKTDGMISPKVFKLTQPNRIVMDLPRTRLGKNLAHFMRIGPYQVRFGEHGAEYLRIVIESPQLQGYQVAPIRHDGASYALSIHLQNQVAAPAAAVSYPVASYTPIPEKRRSKIIVVIDPGHGGKDPGAFGYHRTKEKDVVLAISRRLKRKIDSYPGMQAVLTRDGDYFIDLRRRLEISRRYHPDIFVAIHADAFTNPQSHGASVFALSQRGATSEAARWLAAKENYSELAGVNLKDLDDQNGMVRSVLIDLSQTATIQSSITMGQNVLRYLGGITTLHNHRVEQAGFLVLKSPDTPSILVETGFISNPYEERRLASSAYQEQLSQAIFNGIRQYFQDYPPRGRH